MEAEGAGGSSIGAYEGRGWGVGVRSSSCAGGIVFGNDFCDCGVEVDKEVVFEVARDSGELCVVVLGVVNNLVEKR